MPRDPIKSHPGAENQCSKPFTGSASWSSLWSALEHGATRLESLRLDFWFSSNIPRDIATGFESLVTHNANIRSVSLHSFRRGHDDLAFFVALGRGLAVNTTVQMLNLDIPCRASGLGSTIDKQLIQTVFTEGLDHNMAVETLKVNVKSKSRLCVQFLIDGLERMMRNRASAATRDGHGQEESLPILKELELQCTDCSSQSRLAVDAARDLFFDRPSRRDVIRVETVKFDLPQRRQTLSRK